MGAPTSAPDELPHRFVATASDRAGNSASAAVTLSFVLPPANLDVVPRPNAVIFSQEDMTLLAGPVQASDTTVALTGDQRLRFEAATALAGPPAAPNAPDGLLRRNPRGVVRRALEYDTPHHDARRHRRHLQRVDDPATPPSVIAPTPNAQLNSDDYCGEDWGNKSIKYQTDPISLSVETEIADLDFGNGRKAKVAAKLSLEDLKLAFEMDASLRWENHFWDGFKEGSHIEMAAVLCGSLKFEGSTTFTVGSPEPGDERLARASREGLLRKLVR